MESRLFQYSIPYFSFDNAKFHSMGNEDHSMGNEDLFDGERGSIRWGTRFYSMGNEVVRVYAVTCTETWSTPLLLVSQEWVLSSLEL